MGGRLIYKTFFINLLTALLIGFIISFPDIIIRYENQNMHKGSEDNFFSPEMRGTPQFFRKDSLRSEFPPPLNERDHPPRNDEQNKTFVDIFIDFLFFFFLSWALLSLNNPKRGKPRNVIVAFIKRQRPFIIILLTLIISYLSIYIYGLLLFDHRSDFNPHLLFINGILLFRGTFVFLMIVLFGQLFSLLYKQHKMNVEYEQMKTESLENRFEALTAQISPHFFFNSLNSLSGLIREKENKKALKYISEISNLFRYILKGNWQELVYLKDEIHFLNVYRYLSDIKYENKLKFEINVDENSAANYMLPALSLQPLAENITKHNIISSEFPMLIKIYIKDEELLIIENNYQPKSDTEAGTGIGLSNLRKRYLFLTGKEIQTYVKDDRFIVELPLQRPKLK